MGYTASPCKHCADRAVGCHGICKDYSEWLGLHKEELKKARVTMTNDIYPSDYSGPRAKPGNYRKYRWK